MHRNCYTHQFMECIATPRPIGMCRKRLVIDKQCIATSRLKTFTFLVYDNYCQQI